MKPEDVERRRYGQSAFVEGRQRADKAEVAEAAARDQNALSDPGEVIGSAAATPPVTADEVEGLLSALIKNHAASEHPEMGRDVAETDRVRAGTDRMMAAKDRRREALNDPPGVITSAESAPRITSKEYGYLVAANERDIRADRLDRDADQRDARAAQTEEDAGIAPRKDREMAAGDRASAAEDRHMAAEDRHASLRDHLGDDENVHVAALERGRAANGRDRLADERDWCASERDRSR